MFPYTISVCLDTDSTMPISPSSINKLVPPGKGKAWQADAGVRDRVRHNGHVQNRLQRDLHDEPDDSERCAELIPRAHRNRHAAQEQQQKQRHDQRRPDKTSSSHKIEKIKSFCGSGTYKY